MSSSPEPRPSAQPPKRGPLAWLVFLAAIAAVLAVAAGCMTMMYAPIFTGGS
ncbi:hypothetical protein HDA32_004015 [Spinactinospora alkalitolerans]|uniref:Uncharacterized protein n=1 Tax=Spinactinospora alkalitolerans TaxID=687207 RepID=A0A852U012_9ACTN|nr:hypothetical protein [Spinactinospora alkalitolerans]NYE48895.1 hypothetical protein [Spinactinospora alkalitolerans]